MQHTKTVDPVLDIVSVAELREWMRFQDGVVEQDDVLEVLIDEVINDLESRTNRAFGTQTRTISLDRCEVSSTIYIRTLPLISVTSIVTTDDDGDTTTVATTNYQVRGGTNPRITLTTDGEWPDDMREFDGMVITCQVGADGTAKTFTGFEPATTHDPGLDDMIAAVGTWAGSTRTKYEIVIDAEATPDTIKWRAVTRDADGSKTYGAWTATVNITGAAQVLEAGVSVTFTATTGHTLSDQWNVHIVEPIPLKIKQLFKGLIQFAYNSGGSGVWESKAGQVIRTPRDLEKKIEELRVVPL